MENYQKNPVRVNLTTSCSFSEVFQDLEPAKDSAQMISQVPRLKVGHIRADYNGRRWWNTVWPCHPELATAEISQEIDEVYDALTHIFPDLDALTRFCELHPEACADSQFRQEYNFYLEGKRCNFWIRLITRPRDYNLYLHAFVR